MIEKMNKARIIFTSHDAQKYLERLQELGIADISYSKIDDANHALVKNYTETVHALEVLQEIKLEDAQSNLRTKEGLLNHERKEAPDLPAIIKAVLDHSHSIKKLYTQYYEYQRSFLDMQKYGEVSSADFEFLKQNKIHCTLYRVPISEKKITLDSEVFSQLLFKKDSFKYLLLVSFENSHITVPAHWEEVKLSEFPPKQLYNSMQATLNELKKLQGKLLDYLSYEPEIKLLKVKLENELAVASVHLHAEQVAELLIVEGYIPVSSRSRFETFCSENKLGCILTIPAADDDVPTRQKNIAPVRMMKPLFKLMDTVPGYKEFDISGMFLLALTLFFGMIIGDAGYGLVLLLSSLLCFIFLRNKSELTRLTLYFMLWNSLATIAWGALTGNWFGYPAFAQNTFLSHLVLPSVAITNPQSSATIWYFAFTVGLVHLSIAHLWGILRGIFTRDYFLSVNHLGSGIMIYGLYFLVLTLLLGSENYPFPAYAIPIIATGFALVVISEDQQPGRNFFAGIGIGIAKIFLHALNSLGNFADIISYIRLFAVGLASLSIASAFNGMAQEIMVSGTPWAIAGGIVILLLAHTFNLAMGLLAIIIHGVRLNILEFGMHIGMEWSGRLYTPFRKN